MPPRDLCRADRKEVAPPPTALSRLLVLWCPVLVALVCRAVVVSLVPRVLTWSLVASCLSCSLLSPDRSRRSRWPHLSLRRRVLPVSVPTQVSMLPPLKLNKSE